MFRGTMVQRSDAELKSGIAKFYDESSQIWLDVWGEHMHHGYYPTPQYADHIQVRGAAAGGWSTRLFGSGWIGEDRVG